MLSSGPIKHSVKLMTLLAVQDEAASSDFMR